MDHEGSTLILQKPGTAHLHSGDAVTLSCSGSSLLGIEGLRLSGRRLIALQDALAVAPPQAVAQSFILQRRSAVDIE